MFNIPFTFSIEALSIIFIAISAVAMLEFVLIVLLEVRLRKFMRNKSGDSLEDTLNSILEHHGTFNQFQEDIMKALQILDKRLKTATRGVGTVRFDAFSGDGSGGNQSFATALISENGDGVVISSLHARASTRIFAKSVKGFTSEHELTEEEQKAINAAKEGTN